MTVNRKRTLVLALFVSLILHAGIALLLLLVPCTPAEAEGWGGLQVDACALGPEGGAGNYLVARGEAEPMEAVLLAPSVVIEPSPPDQGPMEAVVQVTAPEGSLKVAGSSFGSGEPTALPAMWLRAAGAQTRRATRLFA